MKINVTENKVSIKEEQILNENEYNIHKIQFDFSSEYTDDLVKVALFSIDNHTYKKIISNNECDIPPEVLTQRGYSILGVYAYKTEQDTLVLRYSPSPTKISVYDGSYKADAENSEPITPSEIEQYQQILQNSLQQFQSQYNALVEETEGDIQAIEDELQRKVDEGYFDGEDGFSPIAKVIQKSNGATIEIEDKNGKTTADVLNGEDGYTPVRGLDYWTEEDKQEVEEEATQQIEGKIEEYNENAAEKLNQYNQNSVQKTNDYNTNAEQKMSAYNTNATEKTSTYNSNATEKFNDYNSNAEQKETNYNTNASSKLSEYNSNAETKKSAYDENATQKTTSFNTNATNKLTEYNTNHTEKMNAYNSNNTEKLNAFNENATQKTEDFDEHTEEIQDNIEILQRTDNQILSRFNKDEEVSGQDITLTGTTEIKFAKPPLPMGNSEQEEIFYIETTIKKGFIDSEGNVRADSNLAVMTDYIPVFPNTLYNINRSISTSYTNIRFFDKNKNFLGTDSTEGIMTSDKNSNRMLANETSLSMTILNNNVAFMVFNDYSNDLNTTYTISTLSPTPDYPQEITNVTGDVEVKVQNKNFLNMDNSETGGIDSSGNIISGNNLWRSNVYIEVEPNTTYTLSRKIFNDNLSRVIRLYEYDNNKTFISPRKESSTESLTITTTANTKYLKWTIFELNATLTKSTVQAWLLQLELGTASTYTPHKAQTFTFPLGNEKLMLGDYLADDGIHHKMGEVVFDGSENWKPNGSLIIGGVYCSAWYLLFPNIKNSYNAILSTYLKGKVTQAEVNSIYSLQISGQNAIRLVFDNEIIPMSISSSSALKTYLSSHNLKAQYELEEEVIVPYTSAQQRVYNEIKNAYSYDEITIITGSSDGNKPFFTVQVYKDINKELNNKVDKIEGKGLSTNDFTDEYKEQVDTNTADISDIQDEQTEQNTEIEALQTENARFKATLPTTGEVTGQTITLNKTAELEFKKPPLPMGNSQQVQYSGKNKIISIKTRNSDFVEYFFDKSINNSFIMSGLSNLTVSGFKVTIKTSNGDINLGYKSIETNKNFSFTFSITTDDLSKIQNSTSTPFIQFWSSNGFAEVDFKNVMIRDSSITNDTYEPYVGGTASPNPDYPQEITNVTGDVEVVVQNKNLLDYTTVESTSNTTVQLIDNGFKVTGKYAGKIVIENLKPNTDYYLQYIRKNITGTATTVTVFAGVLQSTVITSMQNSSYFNTGENTTVNIWFYTSMGGTDGETNFTNIQLEESTTPTDYIEHKEQVLPLSLGNIELCKIGDYQDYFYKESNKWYLHKEISKVVLDGSQRIYLVGTYDNTCRFDYEGLTNGLPINENKAICSRFTMNYGDTADYEHARTLNTSYPNTIVFYISKSKATTENEFNAWLSNNNTTVYYILNTATNTEITDTTLISQLEAINNAISYEEQTNISSNQNALFNVEAYQNTKLLLENFESRLTLVEG